MKTRWNSHFSVYKYSLIRTQLCPFICILAMAAFIFQQQSSIVMTEILWPTKSKIFTTGPLQEKSANLCPRLLPPPHWLSFTEYRKNCTSNQIRQNFHWQMHNNKNPNLLMYCLGCTVTQKPATRESHFPHLALQGKDTTVSKVRTCPAAL